MSKANYYDLPKSEINEHLRQMFKAIAKLNTEKEVENFFRDLLSLSELVMLARRIQIALLLLRGYTHEVVIDVLKVGRCTIVSVDRWLNKGFGGYRNLIKKAKAKGVRVNYKEDFDISFAKLRHSYPAHFWLINLLIEKKKNK